MNCNIEIRKAVTEDIDALLDILNAATQKLLAKNIPQWEYPWDKSEVLEYIEQQEFYIAQSNGKPCGCFGIKEFQNNFVPSDKNSMYFYHLAVHPDYNGKGIGNKICGWVHQYAKTNGVTIYFDCWAGNDKLRQFYTAAGFEFIGEFPEDDYFVAAFKTK